MAKGDEKFQAKKAAAAKADQKKQAEEEALTEKVNQKGGAGKLSRKDLQTAKRMEGTTKDQKKGQ